MSRNIFVKLIVCSVFVILLSTSFCVSSTYALGNIFSQGKGFLLEGKPVSETINTTELEKTSDYIYNTLLAVGIMVAIIVAMVLGIQFMVASADEKAKVKEALMPFIVGCIVVFGAFTIWQVVINMGNKAEKSIKGSSTSSSEYSSQKETSETYWNIENGDLNIQSLSNEQIRQLYGAHYIVQSLWTLTGKDPRYNGPTMSLEDAINSLGDTNRKIYNEAKRRGLLNSNGIHLKQ